MSPLFKFGNGSKDRDTSEEMREILTAMQQERVRQESVVERINLAAGRLLELGEPVERATADLDSVLSRISEVEERLSALGTLAAQIEEIDELSLIHI